MYIDTVPNRNSRPALLLRESRREGRKTIKRTLANMTGWPADVVETIRRTLKGETLCAAQDLFGVERSSAHGHVAAVLATVRRLGVDAVRAYSGLGWLSALRTTDVRALVDAGALQLSLDRIVNEAARRTRTPLPKDEIGVKVGKVINRHKMGKHFQCTIEDGRFTYTHNTFHALLAALGTRCRNHCYAKNDPEKKPFVLFTDPRPPAAARLWTTGPQNLECAQYAEITSGPDRPAQKSVT